MVSSSTSEERTGQGYKGNSREGRGYASRGYQGQNKEGRDGERREYKAGAYSGGRDFRKKDGSDRPNSRNGTGAGQSRDNKTGNNHGRDFKRGYSGGGSKDFSGRPEGKGPSQQRETKVKEQQPDKMDIVKRLEKEKKVMQKKHDVSHKAKNANARPPVKVKRTNNIDWTREYENDSYDDDDAYFMY